MKKTDIYLQHRRFLVAGTRILPGRKLLDIGSNCCEQAAFLKEKNIQYTGIDPEPGEGKSRIPEGIAFVRDTFPSEKLLGMQFDYITALAVIEHIPATDLDAFANGAYDLLKPGGEMILTVPSPLVDYIIHTLRFFHLTDDDMKGHQHYGFRVAETVPVFSRSGFKLVKRRRFQFGLNNLFVFVK